MCFLNFAALNYTNMITIKTFTFNLFATNTFVLSDETGECMIIDPGCAKPSEQAELSEYITKKALTPVLQVITHYHIDHITGIRFIKDTYGIGATAHPDGHIFWENKSAHESQYGFTSEIVPPENFVKEGDKLKFGNSEFDVVLIPGHADGSICLINHAQKILIAGDVIFYGSIGRTDLPTGDFDILIENIRQKLFTLDDNFVVYPGHGQKTTIGFERLHNPFINQD